jgi:O-antigen ligase
MSLRIHHIVSGIFGATMACFALNLIPFMYQWLDLSLTIPTMFLVCVVGFFLIREGVNFPNLSLQLWLIFSFFFLVVALPLAFIYRETHSSVETPYLMRSTFYNMIVTFVSYRFVLFMAKRDSLGAFVNWFLVFNIIGSLMTLFALPLGFYKTTYAHPLAFQSLERMAGLYINPNMAGFQANVTFILGLSTLFRVKSPKLLGVLGVISGFGGMIASFSKTAILTAIIVLVATILIYFFSYSKIEKPTRRITNIFLFLLFYGIFQAIVYIQSASDSLTPDQRSRVNQIERIVTGNADKESTSNRANLVNIGMTKILQRPVFGTGFGSFLYLIESAATSGEYVGIHNIFLRIWGEGGIFSLVFFAVFWLVLLFYALIIPMPWLRLLTVGGVIVLLFFGSTSHNFLEENLVGLFIGLLCGFTVVHHNLPETTP